MSATPSPWPPPNPPSPLGPGAGSIREALRRELRRANLAWVIIVSVIAALALGVVWKAGQSAAEAQRASRSALEAKTQAALASTELWNARLAEARATRIAGGPGAREKARTLVDALAHQPTLTETQRLQLRAEAIAQLALVDVVPPTTWVTQQVIFRQCWDASYHRYVQSFQTNVVSIRAYPSGDSVATLAAPSGAIRQEAAFSHDGRHFMAVFQKPSVVIVWRLEDSATILSNRTTSFSYREVPYFSPDDHTFAIATTNGLELHPLERAGSVVRLPRRQRAEFSPDSRWLVLAGGTNVEIRSAINGRRLGGIAPGFNTGCVAWHPDASRLVLAGEDGRVVLWELPPGILKADPDLLPEEKLSNLVALTDVPPLSASATIGSLRRLEGHAGAVVGVWFSPDGSLLLSQSWDSFSSLWEMPTGRRLLAESRMMLGGFNAAGDQILAVKDLGGSQAPASLLRRDGFRVLVRTGRIPRLPLEFVCSRDEHVVITDHRDCSVLWDRETGSELARLNGHSPVFSPDGRTIYAVTNNAVLQFELDAALLQPDGSGPRWLNGTELFHRERGKGDIFNAISLAPDGRTLVVSATDGGVLLLDRLMPVSPRRLPAPAHYAEVATSGFTNAGQWLVTQMHNREAWLVNLTNPAAKPFLIGYHLNTAFGPGGTNLALATEKVLVLLERNSQRTNGWSRRFELALEIGAGAPAALAFSPDGRMLAVPYNRFDLRLYDTQNGRELATLSLPEPVQIVGTRSIAFSHDGHYLRALRNDGEVIEWSLPDVHTALARLGLDWEANGTSKSSASSDLSNQSLAVENVTNVAIPAGTKTPLNSSSIGPAGAAAAAAGLIALVAGAALFLHQRRTVSAYARAEALAELQQQQLVQAQNALFQSQKMEALGTLAAGVAHDFNNLLSIIRMSNQLVARATRPEGATRENVDAIERAVKQGKAIVDSMLGYSRRPVESIGDFSPIQAIRETVALLSRQFLAGLELHLDLAPECPQAHGSSARLEQALLNLILNASEAMQRNGQLTLSLRSTTAEQLNAPSLALILSPRPAPAFIEVTVHDTGPGIPPEILPRIFEPFFTTKSTDAHRGTGLGLSMVYTIARSDGWGLAVESVMGVGTTFRLFLPTATLVPSPTTLPPVASAVVRDPNGDGLRLPTSSARPGNDTMPGSMSPKLR